MLEITFEYKDNYTHGRWQRQKCVCESLDECKDFYGLDVDIGCDYKIIEVKELE